MSNITFAAGTVNGVYPRPVAADSVLDVLAHSLVTKATDVNIWLTNGFDSDGNYVYETIGDMTGEAFHHVGTQSESSLNFSPVMIYFNVVRRFTLADSVFKADAPTIGELIGKLVAGRVKGTLNIVYQSYPNGRKCYPETEKAFKIIL